MGYEIFLEAAPNRAAFFLKKFPALSSTERGLFFYSTGIEKIRNWLHYYNLIICYEAGMKYLNSLIIRFADLKLIDEKSGKQI